MEVPKFRDYARALRRINAGEDPLTVGPTVGIWTYNNPDGYRRHRTVQILKERCATTRLEEAPMTGPPSKLMEAVRAYRAMWQKM